MGKITSDSARNIEGAGEQTVREAVNNASSGGTQVSLEEFQHSLAESANEARSRVDEAEWEEVSERAEETETEFEQAIDSRAEKYSDEGWEAVPEESEARLSEDEEAGGQLGPDAQPGEREQAREPARRDPDYHENDVENLAGATTLGHNIDSNSPLNAISEVQEPSPGESTIDDPGGGVAVELEEQLFDDARDGMVGNEDFGLPEEKEMGKVGEDLARDEVHGIDFDSLSPPEEEPGAHGSEPDEQATSYTGIWEQVAGEQAELEYQAQKAAERYNKGESPAVASRKAIEETDTRDRSWQGDDLGPATGESFVHRFIESGPSVDTNQAPAVHQAIAQRQPGNEIDLASRTRDEDRVGNTIDGRMDVDIDNDGHVSSDLVSAEDNSGYSSTYEAIADGENFIDDSVDPAPVAQELTADNHSYIGEKAVENLRSAGYTRVADLGDATIDDLTAVDGIGETKAEKIIENEGAAARNLEQTAKRLNDTIRSDEFGTDEYRQILTYAAEKGVPVQVGATIFEDSEVRKEIPGPTAVADLRAGDGESRAYGTDRYKWVDTHETADNKQYSPSGDRYSYQASVEVEATVEQTFEPDNPEMGERQVVHVTDHAGNQTKLTIYQDSVKQWDGEETSAAVGQFSDGETDPGTGIGPNVVLEAGDTITIQNPQVNDYGGTDDDPWDGPTLATTPDTTIKTDGPPREPSQNGVDDGTFTHQEAVSEASGEGEHNPQRAKELSPMAKMSSGTPD